MSLIPRLFPAKSLVMRLNARMYAIQTQKYFVMHVISKQVQVKGQGIKFKVQTATYWKWNLLYTSLVQQTEDVDLTC